MAYHVTSTALNGMDFSERYADRIKAISAAWRFIGAGFRNVSILDGDGNRYSGEKGVSEFARGIGRRS